MDRFAHLEVVTGAFLRDLGGADPLAHCADIRWTTTELAAHLGAVHRWAAANVRTNTRNHRDNVPSLDGPASEWYSASRTELLTTLAEVPADQPTYTLSKADKSVGFWHRRQLFETLVHLWDLRSAADAHAPAPSEVPPSVHADGVSELFDVFLPRAGTLAPLGGTIELVALDTGDRWTFGNDWQRDAGEEPAASVAATAAELLLWAWNRGPQLQASGDQDLVQRFVKSRLRP